MLSLIGPNLVPGQSGFWAYSLSAIIKVPFGGTGGIVFVPFVSCTVWPPSSQLPRYIQLCLMQYSMQLVVPAPLPSSGWIDHACGADQ